MSKQKNIQITMSDNLYAELTMVLKENDLTIHSVRGGSIVGTHEVLFAGGDQIIEIKHSAYSKKVFAYGAVKAAKFLVTKQNGYYNMKDM